jgi:hypothetical protein
LETATLLDHASLLIWVLGLAGLHDEQTATVRTMPVRHLMSSNLLQFYAFATQFVNTRLSRLATCKIVTLRAFGGRAIKEFSCVRRLILEVLAGL